MPVSFFYICSFCFMATLHMTSWLLCPFCLKVLLMWSVSLSRLSALQTVLTQRLDEQLLCTLLLDGVHALHEGTGPYAWIFYIQCVPVSHPIFCSPGCLKKIVHCFVPSPLLAEYLNKCCLNDEENPGAIPSHVSIQQMCCLCTCTK
jgi:hypothetical protein